MLIFVRTQLYMQAHMLARIVVEIRAADIAVELENGTRVHTYVRTYVRTYVWGGLPDVHAATGALAIWRHAGVFVLGRRRGRVV